MMEVMLNWRSCIQGILILFNTIHYYFFSIIKIYIITIQKYPLLIPVVVAGGWMAATQRTMMREGDSSCSKTRFSTGDWPRLTSLSYLHPQMIKQVRQLTIAHLRALSL